MSKLKALLQEEHRSELILKHQLKALSEALSQRLQATDNRHIEELERRIHQDALLSTDVHPESRVTKGLNHQTKHEEMRRSISTSALTSDKDTLHRLRQAEKPISSSSPWVRCSVRASTQAPAKTPQCERVASSMTAQMHKEDEAKAECQKKFSALPVPSRIIQPLYQEMMERREKERQQAHKQRKNFLLSAQKPFSFQEREKEKREKLIASQDQENKVPTVRKPRPEPEKDSLHAELKDPEEVCRSVHAQATVRQENSPAPLIPKRRFAEHTRREKLGFLDEKPSFRPKIIPRVPDFSRLHKALQTESLRNTHSRDVTKCRPFLLRTSALPERQRRMSPMKSQEPKISLSRSKSLGALTSLSPDTLPTYITDAVRKRGIAIRKSLEMRDSKNQEHTEWLRKYQTRSEAMRKTVALHAKLLDPHSSLKEVCDEKLKQHMMADQQRMREYMSELQRMKARVSERPYLFEQVKQKNAKALAEQTYRNQLKKAGLKERFVEEKGAATEGTSTSLSSEEDADVHDHSRGDDVHSREENVDDGEKIEDVEVESVKSKREEMP